jgi:hypothetical protein
VDFSFINQPIVTNYQHIVGVRKPVYFSAFACQLSIPEHLNDYGFGLWVCKMPREKLRLRKEKDFSYVKCFK